MKTYQVRCTYEDRKLGPGIGRSIKVEASSITGAIGKASRMFWKGLSRRERFDAAKSLRVEARRCAELVSAPQAVKAMVDDLIGDLYES